MLNPNLKLLIYKYFDLTKLITKLPTVVFNKDLCIQLLKLKLNNNDITNQFDIFNNFMY